MNVFFECIKTSGVCWQVWYRKPRRSHVYQTTATEVTRRICLIVSLVLCQFVGSLDAFMLSA